MAGQDERARIGRRGFFGAAAAGLSGAALAAGGATPALAVEGPEERVKARYQDSEHVQAFYRVNRYYPKEG